ncbi:MAG: MarR family transcriptional regulator [Candidatus Nanopelagicales bacterium]
MASDAEPWLDETEQQAWVRLVVMMMRLPLELDRQLQRDSELTFFEYIVLSGLSEQPERSLRMSVLAAFTGSQLPRLSQVASRMEAKGWLVRSPDPDDGRYTVATLTDAGYDAVAAAARGHVQTVRELVMDPLSRAQVQQLGTITGRILGAITDDPLPGPAR